MHDPYAVTWCNLKGSSTCEISHTDMNRTVSRSVYSYNNTCQSPNDRKLLKLCILTCNEKSVHEDDKCNFKMRISTTSKTDRGRG